MREIGGQSMGFAEWSGMTNLRERALTVASTAAIWGNSNG
jgi:hypothetical protein